VCPWRSNRPEAEGQFSLPWVSIITPTINRQAFLPALWDCIRAQSVQDIEWLVHDGSPDRTPMFDKIDDPRVRYTHAPEPMKLGAKRNALCDSAKGDIIAFFDDDDFYAPRYLEGMLSFMNDLNADFVKLFGFFIYQRTRGDFAYWDLETDFPVHYRFHPESPPLPCKYRGGFSSRWGYGFSYVFNRRVLEKVRFPDQDHGEDAIFANNAVARFKSAGKQDFTASCIHVVHSTNTATTLYPQQILPLDFLPRLFPAFPT
jgi:glycosyltransferase involved in cell wall biosynthesis